MPHLKFEMPENQKEWDALARKIVRTHMAANNMNYVELAEALAPFGIQTDNKVLANKLRIGKFSAAFFLRVLAAVGAKELTLPTKAE